MADISKLSRLVNGIQRNVDLSANTLVVDNLKVKLGSAHFFTFSGTLAAPRSVLVPDADVNLGHIASLVALSGVAGGSVDLGTFTGITIPDNSTIKSALQSLETALELVGGDAEFEDNLFRITDDGDPTKKIAFEAAGIATATTRTITMPNANVDLGHVNTSIQQDGSRPFTANQSMGNFKLTNVANATNAGDAVNFAQLQSYIAGLDFQADVDDFVADANTTAPGVGLPAAALGQRYILASNTGTLDPAWGTITGVGDNDIVQYDGVNWVVAYDVSVQGEGALVWNRDDNYFMRYDGSSWAEFGGLSGVTAGAGLAKTGNTIFVELDTNAGLEFDTPGDAGKLRVDADDVTIERSVDGIRVKDAGISEAKIATDAVTTAKIQNAAVTNAKLNSDVVDSVTTSGANGSPISVISSPLVSKNYVAGESFAANTSFLVRIALTGETAGRVYKADSDASVSNLFYVIGIALSTSLVNAGSPIRVILLGTHTLGSLDSAFAAGDIGKAVYLTTTGAFSITAPTADNTAVTRIGIVETTTSIFIQPQFVAIN